MRTLIIFNHLNDIVYLNCCASFIKHVERLAETQGLVSSIHSHYPKTGSRSVDPNIIIQLFSPLVTSHRFMKDQFGNPYHSVQCEDGTNIVFQDFMGFLFLRIGDDSVDFLRRFLGITVSLVNYICGPDVSILKTSDYHSNLLDATLSTWSRLYYTEPAFLVEGIEQISLNQQLSSTLIKTLESAATKIVKGSFGVDHVHALLFLDSKLLSWYSTRRSYHLSSEDLLFLMILCQKSWPNYTPTEGTGTAGPGAKKKSRVIKRFNSLTLTTEEEATTTEDTEDSDSDDDSYSSSLSHLEDPDSEFEFLHENEAEAELGGAGTSSNPHSHQVNTDFGIKKYQILLKSGITFVPHWVYIGFIQRGFHLVLVCESPGSSLISQVCTVLQICHDLQETKRELSHDKQYFELLENSTKKILDQLKKLKNLNLRAELQLKWDRFKVGYNTYTKSKDPNTFSINGIREIYSEILRSHLNDKNEIFATKDYNMPGNLLKSVKSDTSDFWSLWRDKGGRNSTSLIHKESITINKYLEEFPGLVHFIYIDRNQHLITMPNLNGSGDGDIQFSRKKIWNMVKFAREHMLQGNFSLMWKDSAFNYAYFLWFEDTTGQAIRPKSSSGLPWDNYPMPGILCGDFYKRLVNESFPGPLSSKIRCVELFCIHLGLLTSSCVLEHSKRLATTICDIIGRNTGVDLL